MAHIINVCIIYLEVLYIKAEVDGYNEIIVNKILDFPYRSNIRMHCKGPGLLSWHYRSTNISIIENPVKRILVSDLEKEYYAIVSIDYFDRANMGFYTCRSISANQELRGTILITRSKFSLKFLCKITRILLFIIPYYNIKFTKEFLEISIGNYMLLSVIWI